jgi:hypothetical protein
MPVMVYVVPGVGTTPAVVKVPEAELALGLLFVEKDQFQVSAWAALGTARLAREAAAANAIGRCFIRKIAIAK